jgi:hypothetical protein
MPKIDSAAPALAPLLNGSTAGELIPKLARHALQQPIELAKPLITGKREIEVKAGT